MTDKRPSDRSIAAAFWEIRPSVVCDAVPFRRSVIDRARELDATAAASPSQPDALETKIYSAENFDKSRLA